MRLRGLENDPKSYASKYLSKATLNLAQNIVENQFELDFGCTGRPPPPPHVVVSSISPSSSSSCFLVSCFSEFESSTPTHCYKDMMMKTFILSNLCTDRQHDVETRTLLRDWSML